MIRRIRRAFPWALAFLSLLGVPTAAAQTHGHGKPPFDVRERTPVRPVVPASPAAVRARARLGAALGRQAVVDVDRRTGTPRTIARLDGFLTGPSGDDAAEIALGFVRSQREVFGLSDEDLGTLRLTRRYTDTGGTTHLQWAQTWRGISAWDNGLRAAVTADGRLINVGGSPLPELASRTADPQLSASQALAEALGDAGRRGLSPRATPRGGADRRTTFSGGHSARLVLFTERRGDVHLAWKVTDKAAPDEIYNHLIDAHSGDVLYRANRVKGLTGRVNAFEFAPDEPLGNTQALRDVPVDANTDLKGPNAWAYVDADTTSPSTDNDSPDATTPASSGDDWTDVFTNNCTSPAICSWGPGTGTITANDRRQSAAQAYYFVNTFHDWLRDSEVAFDSASGAFDTAPAGTTDDDPVLTEVIDSFDRGERNNAQMSTPPDGDSPRMEMFMWTTPDRNAADDATVVYHEYTHGLSNRLVTYPGDGEGALSFAQSGAMGEGWSDWYAMDYLAQRFPGLDDPAQRGEVAVGAYAVGSSTGVRRAALDCPVDYDGPGCANPEDSYGDFEGDFSVHGDGEIWAQTLWDLRTALGGAVTRDIVTDGMRLAPPEPSFLEMRNAILQADGQAPHDGAHRGQIWQVFAHRGMGFAAYARDGNDPAPRESFMLPPADGGLTVTGKVTDAYTGDPIPGALVQMATLPGDPVATTNASGDYSIAGMAAGTYPHVVVTAPGYETVLRSASVSAGGVRVDQSLRRNFAAASGGASAAVPAGQPDYSGFGCGPNELIDNDLATGWGSTSHNTSVTNASGVALTGEKSATITLPASVDVAAFRIDPGAVCGDDDSASTAGYRIETAGPTGGFTLAKEGTFSRADNHRLNEIPVDRAGVKYVRFTMRTPQRQIDGPPPDSGVDYMDAAELQVIGKRPAPPATTTPGTATPGTTTPGTTTPGTSTPGTATPGTTTPGTTTSGTSTPGTDPGPGAGTPGATTPAPDLTAPITQLGLRPGQRIRAALRRGLKVSVDCDESCSGTFSARLGARTAKRVGLLKRTSRRGSVRVASGKIALGPGKRTAKLVFTSRAKARLKRLRRLKLTVAARVSDARGNARSVRLGVTVRR